MSKGELIVKKYHDNYVEVLCLLDSPVNNKNTFLLVQFRNG